MTDSLDLTDLRRKAEAATDSLPLSERLNLVQSQRHIYAAGSAVPLASLDHYGPHGMGPTRAQMDDWADLLVSATNALPALLDRLEAAEKALREISAERRPGEGVTQLGAGWLAISEGEYRELLWRPVWWLISGLVCGTLIGASVFWLLPL